MTLPNFIVIGAQRTGTSYLRHVLNLIPNIYVPQKNEVNFFNYHIYSKNISWYVSLFDAQENNCKVGDISPFYSAMYPEEVKVAKKILSSIKVFFYYKKSS